MALPNGKWNHPTLTQIKDPVIRRGFDSLTSYLGGWVDWSGAFDVIGGSVGNGTRLFEYRLQGDICDYRFRYVIGSTTSWPNGLLQINLPFAVASIGDSYPIGEAIARDNSASINVTGRILGAAAASASFYGPGDNATTTLELDWWQDGTVVTNSWPFFSGGGRVSWGTNDSIRGAGSYRIQV